MSDKFWITLTFVIAIAVTSWVAMGNYYWLEEERLILEAIKTGTPPLEARIAIRGNIR